jgi:RND family efflux transporter MFP subunit
MMGMRKYLGIAMLAGACLLAGCKGKQPAQAAPNGKVTNVEVYTVAPSAYVEYLTLPVIVNPWRESSVGLVQGGQVKKINVDKGSRVREGQVLLETDTETLGANLKMAEANLAYQKNEFMRNQKLFDSGSITEAVFDVSKLQLAQAQSAHDIARKQFEDATLEAPFDGVITERLVEVGNILGPGTPAFRIIQIDRLKVQAGIPEKQITDFKPGNSVNIMFDALPGRKFTGQITYIAPEASTQTRTFVTEIAVNNAHGDIRAGIMGNARIQQRSYGNALLIPLDALIETQQGRKAFIVREDSLATERKITLQSSAADMVMVTSGIMPGDKVITKGQHNLADGDRVKITGEYVGAVGKNAAVGEEGTAR